ncbi:phage portal protein [Nocardia otitidiscaviarum]|uniref:phage portal protein n=1 Tax=Nocardia otitidiscaviarum TaxID=1823 RepID=UPI0018962FB8|nr:phage portal protein [Nocardia otitidiscaviarum]MBF6133501.1 phage portal protein [Nocardia otitidiscaviarum]
MTTQRITLPGLDDDEDRTLNMLLTQLDRKMERNQLRAAYYDGKRAVEFFSDIIPPQYKRLAVVLGWSAKAVDILARRCNLDGFVWPDGDLASIGYPRLDEGNALCAEVSQAIVAALIHSCAFLITTKGGPGEPEALVHAKDAMSATGEWNARTRRLDSVLSIIDRDEKGKPTELALYLDGVTITGRKDGGKWASDRSEHSWGVPAEVLVYKPRLGRPFGSSRISRTVMSLQNQALRTVTRMEGHADTFSWPEFWMLGADESIFKNKTRFQVMLGRIKGIPDDDDAENPRADVKQFPAQSPTPHIEMLKQQAQLFSGETSIPLTSLGVSDMSNPTSADSYIASREDLIAEAEGATDDWTPPLRRTIARALAIANGEKVIPTEWASIDARWRSPVHLSRAAQADAGMKQLTAVPWLAETEVGLELLGLTKQQITRAMAQKRRLAGRGVLAALQQQAAARTAAPTTIDPEVPNADGNRPA